MPRRSGWTLLPILALLAASASPASSQIKPPPVGPAPQLPAGPVRTIPIGQPVVPTAPTLSALTLSPNPLKLGGQLVVRATVQAPAPTGGLQFKVLSEVGAPVTIVVPTGTTSGWEYQPLPEYPSWRSYNFCVTPDMTEKVFPCTHKDARSAALAPFDPATVQITALKLNGDNGMGAQVVGRNASIGVEVRVNAVQPSANITVKADALGYNQIAYARNTPFAATAIPVPAQLAFGGKKGKAVITAELNGRTISRSVDILPLKQVDRTCVYDESKTPGWYSASFDFCTNELSPGAVAGGGTAYAFVRRTFTTREDVFLEVSSSDPSGATVSPSSASVSGSTRGLIIAIKTTPTGGTPRNVTIKVVEGGTYEHTIPLTVR